MKYIKHSFLVILLALNIHFAQGITPSDGDIVFTQVSSTNNFFEFVTLVDGLDLTQLKITDNGVTSSGNINNPSDNESGVIEGIFDLSSLSGNWTNVPGGTFIRLGLTDDNDPYDDRIMASSISPSGNFSLTPTGDQLIAYTGSENSPTFIACLNYSPSGWALWTFSFWIFIPSITDATSYNPGTSSNIMLPNGSNFYFVGNVDGTKEETLAAFAGYNNSNWTNPTELVEFQDLSTNVGNSALPVELTSFTASISNDRVILEWKTATEVNNYGFEIERSSDESSGVWDKIGFVEGHGNSYSPKDYLFVDTQPLNAENSYRLKQLDTDGAYEYSDEIAVEYSVIEKTELYQNHPNPFNPTTTITFSLREPTRVNLTIYNAIGQKIADLLNRQMAAGEHSVEFNASGLATGFYLYRIDTPNFSKTMKMILLR